MCETNASLWRHGHPYDRDADAVARHATKTHTPTVTEAAEFSGRRVNLFGFFSHFVSVWEQTGDVRFLKGCFLSSSWVSLVSGKD